MVIAIIAENMGTRKMIALFGRKRKLAWKGAAKIPMAAEVAAAEAVVMAAAAEVVAAAVAAAEAEATVARLNSKGIVTSVVNMGTWRRNAGRSILI